MTLENPLIQVQSDAGAAFCAIGGRRIAERFGDSGDEYVLLDTGVGLHDRSYRGLLEVTGRDRARWLENLTTNRVAELSVGQTQYMFACNVKGRIVFDLLAMVGEDSILLDVDRRWVDTAMRHLNKYVVTEDVVLADRSDAFHRLALVGAGWEGLVNNEPTELTFGPSRVAGREMIVLAHRFAGMSAAEIFPPAADVAGVWSSLCGDGARPVGLAVVQVRRIEAGIPWPVQDIDDQVLPGETGQLKRAISFDKGCYLGQEVVERMRAHGSLARKLVGVRATDGQSFPSGSTLVLDDETLGRVTSSCLSPAADAHIGLGYVRTAHATPGTELVARWDDGQSQVCVAALPFVPA
jgi:folate-binding protein YgfZ